VIIPRFFILHVLVLPLVILGLLGGHLGMLVRHKHTQFAGEGRTEHNVVGSYLWPVYALRSVGLFAAVFAVLSALGGLAQINPIWLYGPFHAPAVSTAAQPDWYMGWLEGALRIFPAWRIHIFGYTISEVFWPGIVLPGLTFLLLYAYPFVERFVTRDRDEHNLLDRPRDRPIRTSLGIGTLTFYVVLFFAGAQDIIAQKLRVSVPPVTFTFRILVFVLPALAAVASWKLCHDLMAHDAEHPERVPRGWPPVVPAAPAPPAEKAPWWKKAFGVVLALFAWLLGRRKARQTS
jgi:ubiquinol-cytochrome c reductase cytochrome b subunit